MSFDSSHLSDTGRRPTGRATGPNATTSRGNVPHVSEFDPLPHIRPEGRWGEPFHEDGKWRQALRHPDKLTTTQRINGLLSYLVTADELSALRKQQDALLARINNYEREAEAVVDDIRHGRKP